MKSKLLSLMMALCILFSLAACGQQEGQTTAASADIGTTPAPTTPLQPPATDVTDSLSGEAESLTEPQTSEGETIPLTEAPTTEAPTTEAPTTEAPTTESPTTEAPTTEAPTTESPTTEAPTTEAPTTEAPTTEAPTTEVPPTEESPVVTVDQEALLKQYFEEKLLPEKGLMDQEEAFAIAEEGILVVRKVVLYPEAGLQIEPESVRGWIDARDDYQRYTEQKEKNRQDHQGIFFYKIIENQLGSESKMLIGSYRSESNEPEGMTHWELYGVRESEVVLLNEYDDGEESSLFSIMDEQYLYMAHTQADEPRLIWVNQRIYPMGITCYIHCTDENLQPVSRLTIRDAEGTSMFSDMDASHWKYDAEEIFFDGRETKQYTIPATIPFTTDFWEYTRGKTEAGLSSLFGEKGYQRLSCFHDRGFLFLNEDLYPYWGQVVDQGRNDTELKWDPSKVQKGDVVSFGQFEQDNNLNNGPEEIEWIVLEQDKESLTLISRYILDTQMYSYGNVWRKKYEYSTVRSWLNIDFGGSAFSWGERSAILGVFVGEEESPVYPDVYLPGDISDAVSFLSTEQVGQYFPNEADRLCQGTPYALGKGLFQADNGYSPWWTRTPGENLEKMTLVRSDGSINWEGRVIEDPEISFGIRPVIRLSKEALHRLEP